MDRPAQRPVIFAVDGDDATLARLGRDLTSRYGVDYAVGTAATAADATAALEALRHGGAEVALVIAALSLPDGQGLDLLDAVHALHPHAKRVLLRGWYGP